MELDKQLNNQLKNERMPKTKHFRLKDSHLKNGMINLLSKSI